MTGRPPTRRALWCLAVAALLTACGAAPGPKPPNLLIVSLDAMRYDAMSSAGNPHSTSPFLDRLGEESVVFTQAITSFPGTTASMPSLMTGLWPSFEGVPQWNPDTWNGFWDLKSPEERGTKGLTDNVTTLAEILSARGWQTAGFNTNPFLGASFNFNQGFAHFEQFLPYLAKLRQERPDALQPSYPPADVVLRAALQWIRQAGDQPWFVWIHLMEPHSPYQPPEPLNRAYPWPWTGASDLEVNQALYHRLFARRGHAQAAERPSAEDLGLSLEQAVLHARGLYEGEVAFADRQMEGFVGELRRAGDLDRTLLVVTADHGEEFLDHGHVFHDLSQPGYEELIRIPLIVRFPDGFGAGTRIENQVRMVDVAPSLVSQLGMPEVAATMSGRDLTPLIEGVDTADRPAFISAPGYGIVRTPEWKLRIWRDGRPAELYRITDDPLEGTDVASTHAEVRDRLLDQALEFASTLRSRGELAPASESPTLSEETREQLEALGYTD